MRNKLLLVALVVVGLASVAYAAYSQTLTINGTGTATGDWDVKITAISQTSATGATDVSGSPSFTDTSATFDVNLAYPGATATYDVTITNGGSIGAKLDAITNLTTLNAAAPAYITYSVSGVAANDVIAAGATDTAQVTVTWDSASTPDTSSGNSKSATIELDYVQE